MMNEKTLVEKIEALNEWEALIEEAKAMAESIKDELKQEMLEKNLSEMEAGQYIVRYVDVLSNRFDTTAFKKQFGDLYKTYTKQVPSKRFSISA